MKPTLLLSPILAGLLAGCGGSGSGSSTPTNAPGSSPLSAPADYLGAMGKAQRSAVKTVDVASLNQAIQMFHVDEGRYPADLNELISKNYLPHLPKAPYGMKIAYDAARGKVTVVQAP